jgi:rare lipoprotein A (peptidoglycan hydrolase)
MLLGLYACVSKPRYRTSPVSTRPAASPQKNGNHPPPEDSKAKADAPPVTEVDLSGAFQVGKASYYGHKFNGRPTASGEIFDMNGISAAHRELPLGTIVRVTHLGNGRSIVLKVNDRGPFIDGRILDLSLGAAKRLDMIEEGVAEVKIEIVREID